MVYHFILQGAYFVLSLFIAFFLSISFRSLAGIDAEAIDYASGYIPIHCTLGTFASIFNQSLEMLLLLENKNSFNLVRSLSTSLL